LVFSVLAVARRGRFGFLPLRWHPCLSLRGAGGLVVLACALASALCLRISRVAPVRGNACTPTTSRGCHQKQKQKSKNKKAKTKKQKQTTNNITATRKLPIAK
jgi:hypothetical protein